MGNEVVAASGGQVVAVAESAADLKRHVQVIQQTMAAVMKPGVHYGKPFVGKRGDDDQEEDDPRAAQERERKKLVLLKPGAEVLGMAFHIAPKYEIDADEMDGGHVAYRIRCIGTHQGTGVVLGEGLGEASTLEEKYRWRRAVCDEEYDQAEVRRVKWQGGRTKQWKVFQVGENPADKRNTVLKMACKRAHVAMILNVTAASDMFTQDLDDEIDGDATERTDAGPERKKPQARGKGAAGAPPAATPTPAPKALTPEQNREAAKARISARLVDLKVTVAQACADCKIPNFETLTKAEFETLSKYADELERARAEAAKSAGAPAGAEQPEPTATATGTTADFVDAMNEAERKGGA